MPFTAKTLDLLVENRLHDSKEWYHAHKDDFRQAVTMPMLELSEQLQPLMEDIDSLLVTQPKRTLSRVYRDTRYTRDKSLFREVMWLSFVRDKNQFPCWPGMFFEFSPNGWRYGCGWWQTPAPVMEAIRTMVLEGDKDWEKAHQVVDGDSPLFAVEGLRYKRAHWQDRSPAQRLWLEQRSVCVLRTSTDFDLLFSSRLAPELAAGFRELAPVYRFFCKASALAPSL